MTGRRTGSADSAIAGYHVYRAASATGAYTRLTSSPIAAKTYTDANGTDGATYMVLGSVYSSGYNPSAIAYEPLAGLRVPVGPLWINAEGRFGIAGPSTVLAGISGAF